MFGILFAQVQYRVESVKTGFGRKIASLAEKETSIASEDVSKIKDQIIAVYKEWIQIHGHPATSLRSQLNYVSLVRIFLRVFRLTASHS